MHRNPIMVNSFDPATAHGLPEADAALIGRRSRLLGPAYRLFYERPIHIVRGEGVWLFDSEGRRYLDAYNNVAAVGHCHPRVVEAISRQASTLNTHTRYLHRGILDYAEALLATMPEGLGHVMFTCTGSEANDLAVRVAKACTGGTGFLVTANAYHGVTDTVASLSPSLGEGVAPGQHVVTIAPPDGHRGDVEGAFAAEVERGIAALAARGARPAALLVDTIFSSDGVYADPAGFLRAGVDRMRAAGGLFIADEVQPGFGRIGAAFWGFARHGLVPDLVTMGKPMGNGQPIAALVGRANLLDRFGAVSRYFNTFGGNPVSIAAAQAVLDVIQDDDLATRAERTGRHLRDALTNRAERHPCIGEVRGCGLYIGADVKSAPGDGNSAQTAARIVNGLRDRQVLISASGPTGDVLKIRPPLPFGEAEADVFLSALDAVLATLA